MLEKLFKNREKTSGNQDKARRKAIYHEFIKIEEREKEVFSRQAVDQAIRNGGSIVQAVVQGMFQEEAKAPPYHLSAIAKIGAKYGLSERQIEDIYKEFSGNSYF